MIKVVGLCVLIWESLKSVPIKTTSLTRLLRSSHVLYLYLFFKKMYLIYFWLCWVLFASQALLHLPQAGATL